MRSEAPVPPEAPADVTALLDAVENDQRRRDSYDLLELFSRVSGETPHLRSGIVGFGEYHYRYDSGREGDWFKVGFSPRKANLTVYLLSGMVGYDDLLDRLGPHKTGKSCIYIRRLADIDQAVLAELIGRGITHIDQVSATRGSIPRMSEMPPPR